MKDGGGGSPANRRAGAGAPLPFAEQAREPLCRKAGQVVVDAAAAIASGLATLNFCAAHIIATEIEVIGVNAINEAFDRDLKSDVRYRFVIDMATL